MSKSVEVSGLLKEVFEEVVISEKLTLKKFAVTVDPQSPFPQNLLFQLANNKIALLDEIVPGQEIKVVFNLQGKCRAKDGVNSYYNSLEVWKIERI